MKHALKRNNSFSLNIYFLGLNNLNKNIAGLKSQVLVCLNIDLNEKLADVTYDLKLKILIKDSCWW